MPGRMLLAGAALAALFVATAVPFLGLPPGLDGWKNLWLVANVPASTFLTDPLAAAYAFQFYFEPLWTLLFGVDLALAPYLGSGAWHVVNVAAALAIAAQVARFAGGGAAGAAAAVVFLVSAPAWFLVGMATARNYLVATALALAALGPFWRRHERGTPVRVGDAVVSAFFYAFAVAAKESVAALPALLFALDLQRRRSLVGSLAAVAPHAVALALLLAWRGHILGGLGGYWMQERVAPENLLLVFPLLAQLLWGAAWPAAAVGLLAAAWHDRAVAARVAAGCLVAVVPFVLVGNFAPPELGAIAAVRLVLPWALLSVLLGRGLAALAQRQRAAAGVLLVLLLGLQGLQRPLVYAGLVVAVPLDPVADAAAQADGPAVVVTAASMAAAFEHQMRPATRPALAAYQSPTSYLLDRALGWQPPPGAAELRVDPTWRVPPLEPLDLGDSVIDVGPAGHFRLQLRLPPGAKSDLFLTWIHENGPTRWVVTLPIGRSDITLPLSHSIRQIVLSRFATGSERWQVHVWDSPFFRPTFP